MKVRRPAASSVHDIIPSGCVTAATQNGLAWGLVELAGSEALTAITISYHNLSAATLNVAHCNMVNILTPHAKRPDRYGTALTVRICQVDARC